MLIKCDSLDRCGDTNCTWGKGDRHNGEMIDVHCNRIDTKVSVLKVDSLPKDNPNSSFKRKKKHGF